MRFSVLAVVLSMALGSAGAHAVAQRDWTTYRNARHGYMISFPTATFEADPASENADGRLMLTRDGGAKLLVGAFPNEEALTLDAYRAYLIETNYANARIDYAPLRARWFVLSGVRDGTVFYERVTFTCGGRLINSWAMLYPESEKQRFDRLVEQIARTYTAGAGATGNCE